MLLFDRSDPSRLKRTRVVRDEETGLPLIVTEQNTAPFLAQAARDASMFDKGHARRAPAGIRRVASLPAVIWMRLKALGIMDDEKALRRWLSERDHRAFRTDDGGRLS